ncbi:cytochrome P450 [Actinomadura pelletieri DSM 43383]|uniref:Cytochrome P450 n=1 Tax=Actinomadura pelletieri DSM 43383 TaxID=1120940 RepID=A0A495QA81_9ACTN|nr:cytochrome P450 [Actinomadura pelletieri]RKS68214.1 cytochrome P450 [Actinomadura pelletieri DSM 43383]
MADSSPSTETAAPVELPIERSDPFDPPPELGRYREESPLRRLAYPDGHIGWLVTGHALARTILSDSRFSARMELKRSPVQRAGAQAIMGRPAPPGTFIAMDPPDHTRFRRLLTREFTARRMKALEPRIETIVADHLDAMEKAGPPTDLVPAFAQPIPLLVICELLGVPLADQEIIQRTAATVVSLGSTPEQVREAMITAAMYLRELAGRKRAEPTDDLLSALVNSGELTDDEITGVGMLLLGAGHETTTNMLALGTYALLRHPAQMERLRADPALAESAVEELLRYLTVVQYGTTRAALEDVELDGHLIKEGEVVAVSLPAANRDPARFTDPDALDLASPATGHLAFGHGVHQCLGQPLARIEMRVGYLALLNRFPGLRLDAEPDGIPMREDMNTYGVHRLPVSW